MRTSRKTERVLAIIGRPPRFTSPMSTPDPYAHGALGRPLDPSYPTNLAILVITPLFGVAGCLWGGSVAWADAISWAGTVFLAWALAFALGKLGLFAHARSTSVDATSDPTR